MPKKIFSLFILILLAIPLVADEPGAVPVDKKVGYALLDAIAQTFQEMAMTGTGGVEKVTQAVHQFMVDARKAKEQKQIDDIFFVRYQRILAIIKLAVVKKSMPPSKPVPTDEEREKLRTWLSCVSKP